MRTPTRVSGCTATAVMVAALLANPTPAGGQRSWAPGTARSVPSEGVRGVDVAILRAAAQLRRTDFAATPDLLIELSPFDAAAARQQRPTKSEPLRVGSVRALPEAYRAPIDGTALRWSPVRGGGFTTTLGVRSPGAVSVRMSVLFGAVPAGIEVRFFSPYRPERGEGPFDRERLLDADRGDALPKADGRYPLWSAPCEGDGAAMEIWVAEPPRGGELVLTLGDVGHLWDDPLRPRRFEDIGASQACEVDVACFPYWVNFASEAVAKYVFSDAVYLYLCTGTVMNDSDPSSYRPFFLTAAHCVSSAAEAAAMTLYWDFWRSACGGSIPGELMTTSGALLHYTSGDVTEPLSTDHTLLELEEQPPGDYVLSGWDANDVTRNYKKKQVHTIHHPSGDLMMASQGKVKGFKRVVGYEDGTFSVFTKKPWNEIQVIWSRGVTEGGSSGAGLFVPDPDFEGSSYLIGVLTGGGSSCSNSKSPDYYGRFDLTYARSATVRRLLGGE